MYKHLTLEQRYQIEALLQQGISLIGIACILHVHKSTISREIKRNSLRKLGLSDKYKAENADNFAQKRVYKPWSYKTKDLSITQRIVWLLRQGVEPSTNSPYLPKQKYTHVLYGRCVFMDLQE